MYDLAWLAAVAMAASFSAIQLFAHRGGIGGTLASVFAWLLVYFGSSNIAAVTSAGLVTTESPLWVWFAAFMIAVHVLVLLFVIAGVGPWSDEDDEALSDVAGQTRTLRERMRSRGD